MHDARRGQIYRAPGVCIGFKALVPMHDARRGQIYRAPGVCIGFKLAEGNGSTKSKRCKVLFWVSK